jgi:hypothetical protein
MKPTANLATSLSGPKSAKSVRLFKRLLCHGKRIDCYQGAQFIAGKEAYQGKKVPKGNFMLFRWHIDCCTGEIEPVGTLVRSNIVEIPNKTSWVRADDHFNMLVVVETDIQSTIYHYPI